MTDFPSGTITFLFTDIEGSTQLWEHSPEVMKGALARHDTLLREHIEANRGYVFKTAGDAFCAGFASASDALSAALAGQHALHAEAWPSEIGAIRVRAALHTGAAEERGGDYFGPALNRVARLLAAGHGGQTLLSLATQELVRDSLPQGTSLADLGEHRLKDLFRPERVFQLNASGLPTEFPPLKTLDVKLTNLPAQPTPFIGRDRELTAVIGLLRRDDVRLVTLTGTGGTGKTRLSLQAAADLLDEYEHGVYFVPLATITNPDLVIPTIAAIFNLKESDGQPIDALLKQYLAEKHLLLVLDNLEQVISAAPKIGELLSAAPHTQIVVSSREKLRLYGEHEYPVPPLGLPDMKKKPTIAVLSQYEAVALFIQRAKAANPSFEITEANAPAVAEICVWLDGLPLAIELAAARSKLLTPQAMLDRLSSRLKSLIGGARDLPVRQQTIRGTIDWSYNLLDEGEKLLFTRLGVFVGGWTLEVAEAVCAENLPMDVFDGLESLTDKSLIRQAGGKDGETRFMMLETIREYASEKLEHDPGMESVRGQHAAYFVMLAERAEQQMGGPDQYVWLDRLADEIDNFRAAMGWALANDAEVGLRIATSLSRLWTEGYTADGLAWIRQLLSKPEAQAHTRIRVKALTVQSILCEWIPDMLQAQRFAEESLELSREIGDRLGEARNLQLLGHVFMIKGDYPSTWQYFEASLALYRELNNKLGLAEVLRDLGYTLAGRDIEQAKLYLNESLMLERELGNISGIAWTLSHLGRLALHSGDYAVARARYEESLPMLRRAGHRAALEALGEIALREGDYQQAQAFLEESIALEEELAMKIGWAPVRLAYVFLRQGDTHRARTQFNKSQAAFKAIGIPVGVIYSLEGLASLMVMQGKVVEAAAIFAWADEGRASIPDPRPPSEQADVDRDLATIRAQIDEATFAAAQAEGRAMTMDKAIALALEEQA